MKVWTIGKRVAYGFSAVLLITLLVGCFALSRLFLIRTATAEITAQEIPVFEKITALRTGVLLNNHRVYEHILCTNEAGMHKIEGQILSRAGQNGKIQEECGKMLVGEKARELFDKAVGVRASYIQKRKEILQLSYAATNEIQTYQLELKTVNELDPLAAQYDSALTALADEEQLQLNSATAQIMSAVGSSVLTTLLGEVGAIITGAILAFLIIRTTIKVLKQASASLSEGSTQISIAAGQVSSGSQALAQGAGEHAAAIEETSSSLEEMSSVTQRNAENAQKANELAKEARAAADCGVADMQTMSIAMEALKTSSNDIAKIIKTIDEIAFQTNILALNAAVEAARAGEAGMGFAVVADEVRNLAQRSAQAAKETAAKIEGAITNTAQGVDINAKVAQVLNEIAVKVRQVDELVAEVAGASGEQSRGITQINTAIGQMDKATQANAASAEESAAAAEELNAQAELMKESVGELLQLVGSHEVAPAGQEVKVSRVHRAQPPGLMQKETDRFNGSSLHSVPGGSRTNILLSPGRNGARFTQTDEF